MVTTERGDISLDELTISLSGINDNQLAVGWFDSARYDDQTPVAYIASIHEFGTAGTGIPPRPFMRPTIANHKDEWRALLTHQLKSVVNGKLSTTDVLDRLGLLISGQIRQTISTLQTPPLQRATVQARLRQRADKATVGALDKPLVDTGTLIGSVTHEVTP